MIGNALNTEVKMPPSDESLSNVQRKILLSIKNNPNITINELTNSIEKDRSTILWNIWYENGTFYAII